MNIFCRTLTFNEKRRVSPPFPNNYAVIYNFSRYNVPFSAFRPRFHKASVSSPKSDGFQGRNRRFMRKKP